MLEAALQRYFFRVTVSMKACRARARWAGVQHEASVTSATAKVKLERELNAAVTKKQFMTTLVAARKKVVQVRTKVRETAARTAAECRQYLSTRGASQLLPGPTARFWLVVLRTHGGAGLTLWKRKLSVAVCHSVFRKGARIGDVFLGITCAPSAELAPKAYRLAVYKRGVRVLVAAGIVRHIPPFHGYHTSSEYSGRPDRWYRPARAGDEETWTDAAGREWGKRQVGVRYGPKPEGHVWGTRDLTGNVPICSQFFRYNTSLEGAPDLPKPLAAHLEHWNGYGSKTICARGDIAAAKKLLRRLSPTTI